MNDLKRNILYCIDNKTEEMNLVNYFKSSNCVLKVARNTGDIRQLIKINIFSFCLVDDSFNENHLELISILESARIPFALLTENKTNAIYNTLIKKPFTISSLVSVIQEKTGIKVSTDGSAPGPDEHITINIEEIYSKQIAPFDYFVKINKTKYIKIAKANQKVSIEILDNLKNKGMHTIYVLKSAYLSYLDSMAQNSINISGADVPDELKIKFLAKTSDLIMDQIYNDGISKELFFSSKQVLDSSLDIMSKNKDIFNIFHLLNQVDEESYRHSLGMSIYSVLIAKELKWETEGTLFKLSLGALFSDIGLKYLKFSNNEDWVSEDAVHKYKTHPLIGAKIISECEDIHQDIVDIIAQHHENSDGTGFPRKLQRKSIHPLARVVRVAHEFCALTFATKDNPSPDRPEKVIKQLYSSQTKKIDLDLLAALAKVYGLNLSPFSQIA